MRTNEGRPGPGTRWAAGAEILSDPDDVWDVDLVLKVKEPVAEEYPRMRAGRTLFTYLHLAASRDCTEALLKSGIDAVASDIGVDAAKTGVLSSAATIEADEVKKLDA